MEEQQLDKVFEALISGLCVMLPNNPYEWIRRHLLLLYKIPKNLLEWDTFISEEMHPKHPLVRGLLFRNRLCGIKLAEYGLISQSEKRRLAISFFEINQKRIFTRAWQKFVCIRFFERERKMELIGILRERLQSKAKSKVFAAWHDFVQHKLSAREVAIALILNVRNQVVLGKALTSWRRCALADNDMLASLQRQAEQKQAALAASNARARDLKAMLFDAESYETHEEEDRFGQLPDHILEKIFSYLTPVEFTKCSLVCRSWKVAVDTNAASGHLDLSKFSHRMQDWLLWKLAGMGNIRLRGINLLGCSLLTPNGLYSLSKCKNLQDVCLSRCAGVTDSVVSSLICQWPTLLTLDLSFTPITDLALNQIALHARNLSNLSLAHCVLITDIGTSFFLNSPAAAHLYSLNLSGCSGLTEVGLVSLVHALPQLRQWILDDTPMFSECMLKEMGKSEFLEGVTLRLMKPMEPVKPSEPARSRKSTLNKEDAIPRKAAVTISADQTAGIAALLKPSLRSLRLYSLDSLSDASFDCIQRATKRISNCALQRGNLNSHRAALTSASKITSFICANYVLTSLAINDCPQITDKLLEKIVGLPKITCLNLSRCANLTDAGVKIITESAFIGCLRELYLSQCSLITDNGVFNIFKRAHNLAYLGVDGCSKLSDVSLSTIRVCPKLTWMNLAGTQCADVTVTAIACLPLLSSVNFSECLKLSDSSLRKLASTSARFEVLKLSKCQITGSSVAAIGHCCPRLCELDVSGCPQIPASAFNALQKGCPNLRYLGIRNCPGITGQMVDNLNSWIETVDYQFRRTKK